MTDDISTEATEVADETPVESAAEAVTHRNGSFWGPSEDGVATPEDQLTAYQSALLRERDGYVLRGDAERVAGVEAELARSGLEVVEQATSAKPKTSRAKK